MDLTSLQTIKYLLKKHHLCPSKRLGQYFLINKKVLEKIVQTANLTKKDTVIEIGPGIGTLTQELAKKAKRVIAVEKDRKMCQVVRKNLKDYENIEVINKDILKFSIFSDFIENLPMAEPSGDSRQSRDSIASPSRQFSIYKVVGNLPYYITAPIIRRFLESDSPPKEMVFLIQKEVAERICTRPGKMSILAVAVQFYAKPEIVKIVSKESFWPVPKVDSALVKITPIHANKKANTREFFRIVKAGFSSPRKQLVNNLVRAGLPRPYKDKEKVKEILKKIKINPQARPQELKVEDWKELTRNLKHV